jgi:hypothetical protein
VKGDWWKTRIAAKEHKERKEGSPRILAINLFYAFSAFFAAILIFVLSA